MMGSFLYYSTFYFLMSVSLVIFVYAIFVTIQICLSAHKKSIVSGEEALIGMEAEVMTAQHSHHVTVNLLGEIWKAESKHPVRSGQRVQVLRVEGLVLIVQPITRHSALSEE